MTELASLMTPGNFVIGLTVVAGIVCIAIAFFGEDNIDAPDWFDSTWF